MKFSEIKEVKQLVGDEWKEAVMSISLKVDDFEIENYRFIHQDEIDEIQQNEIGDDGYLMGCFNSWFLAEILEIDQDVIDEMQKKDCYEAIGIMILRSGKLEELQRRYVQEDTYGHHFAHYDHCEHEIGKYYAFKVN